MSETTSYNHWAKIEKTSCMKPSSYPGHFLMLILLNGNGFMVN